MAYLDAVRDADQLGGLNKVTIAIRSFGPLTCDALAQIFDTLAAQMKESGFSDVDLDLMDECKDVICGDTA